MSSLLSKSDIFSSEAFVVWTSTKRKGLCASKGQIFFYFWALLTFRVVDSIFMSSMRILMKQNSIIWLWERVQVLSHETLYPRGCVFLGSIRDCRVPPWQDGRHHTACLCSFLPTAMTQMSCSSVPGSYLWLLPGLWFFLTHRSQGKAVLETVCLS